MHELQILVHKLHHLSIKLLESFQVGAIYIIAKLPQNWNNRRKKLSHVTVDITLKHIQKHFRIKEISRTRKVQKRILDIVTING